MARVFGKWRAGAWLILGAMVFAGALGGCQKPLFADDPGVSDRLHRYYGGDSAVAASEQRRQRNQMGFGFPAGLGNQQ